MMVFFLLYGIVKEKYMCLKYYEFEFRAENDIDLCILAHNKKTALKIINVLNERYSWLEPYRLFTYRRNRNWWISLHIFSLEKDQFESVETWERL